MKFLTLFTGTILTIRNQFVHSSVLRNLNVNFKKKLLEKLIIKSAQSTFS